MDAYVAALEERLIYLGSIAASAAKSYDRAITISELCYHIMDWERSATVAEARQAIWYAARQGAIRQVSMYFFEDNDYGLSRSR